MAKRRTSKARTAAVPSLKPHVTRSLSAAKALRGKVVQSEDLEGLITDLERLKAAAENSCGPGTNWSRKFAMAATPAKKASRKSAKKR